MTKKNIDTKSLEHLGLSSTEIKIYITLLSAGPSQAGNLIRRTGIQNSVMHLSLRKLCAGGFLSYILKGKIRVYQAVDPRNLLRMLDSRRQEVAATLPALMALHNPEILPEAEIYEGMIGLQNMCLKLIEDSKPGDEFLFFGFCSNNKEFESEVYQYYREYTDIRMNRGLVLRGIAHESMRQRFAENLWPHSNIKFVSYPTLKNISICNNKVIIVPWENTKTSFLITSKSFTDNCREYFNEVWNHNFKKQSGRDKLLKP